MGLADGSVHAAVTAHNMEFEACYLQAIEARPGAQGKMILDWRVDVAGRPADIVIRDVDPTLTMASPCMLAVIQTLTFPPSAKERKVIYPFYFSENGKFRR